jgi:hypothetical protein
MVPGVYIPIPLEKLPMTATGKTDRQRVRELGRTYSLPVPASSDASTSDAILTNTTAVPTHPKLGVEKKYTN